MLEEYHEFLKTKQIYVAASGFEVDRSLLNKNLFNWQQDIDRWALRKGKAALFEDCGLGKTIQQLEYAYQVNKKTGGDIIILAPLSVSAQTAREGSKFGIDVSVCKEQKDIKHGINITNYERLDNFNFSNFAGVILDESSILKAYSGKTKQQIINTFEHIPYKLACTATPAPNDFMELGNHAEFLGIMTRSEMLATFFVHDGGDTSKWRLKGHAEDKFWEWVASWAVVLQNPSDLGYDGSNYDLPSCEIIEHIIKTGSKIDADGQLMLFAPTVQTLNERRAARRNSLAERVAKTTEIANSTNEQVLVWCDLNEESTELTKAINGAIEVKGSDSSEHKEKAMMDFTNGAIRCLVSKPSIAGWGMNWQNCNNMIFCGISDSFEAYYQAIRRCWRYGQKNKVNIHIVTSDAEGAVKANIERKQADTLKMQSEMVKYTKAILQKEIQGTVRMSESYIPTEKIIIPNWLISEVA